MIHPEFPKLTINEPEWPSHEPIKVTASQTGFGAQCPACLWYDHHCTKSPRGIFPRIFNDIDRLNKNYYEGLNTKEISPDLPPGRLGHGDLFLESEIIHVPGHRPFFLRGKIDILATFDGDFGYGVCDFKTANPKADHIAHYIHQLGCYAYMLDRPAKGRQRFSPVNHIGILCLTPTEMCSGRTGRLGYLVSPEYIAFERNDDALIEFIVDNVISVLELPEQPAPTPTCELCLYRHAISEGF